MPIPIEQLLRKYETNRTPTGSSAPPGIGGVPSDYRFHTPAQRSAFKYGPAGIGHAGSVGSRYSKGQEYQLFAGKDPAYIRRLQTQLIQAGILDRRHGVTGSWTPSSAAAMEAVMGHANWSGQSWHGALGELAQAGSIASSNDPTQQFSFAPFVAQTYLEPDPKLARMKVRDLVTQIVGEEYINSDLVDKYTAQLMTDYERQFRQKERLRRQEYNAERQIARGQFDFQMGTGSMPDEDDLRIKNKMRVVDPEANLRAALEKRFRPTKRGIQQHQKAQNIQPSLFGSLQSMINMGSSGNVQTL